MRQAGGGGRGTLSMNGNLRNVQLECIGSHDLGKVEADIFGKFKSRLTESARFSQQIDIFLSRLSPGHCPVRMANFTERKKDSSFFPSKFWRLNPVILF